MNRNYTLSSLALSLILGLAAPTAMQAEPKKKQEEAYSKIARLRALKREKAHPNDVHADEYILYNNHQLYRVLKRRRSHLDRQVEEMHVASHAEDTRGLYYRSKGDLRIVDANGEVQTLMTELRRRDNGYMFDLVSQSQSKVVSLALNNHGHFIAWTKDGVGFQLGSTKDYRMNPHFGCEGPYSSYVAFTIDYNGFISKVKCANPAGSKTDYSRSYKDLEEYFRINAL